MEWEPVVNELVKVVVLAFLVERALAVIFDMERVEPKLEHRDLKPVIAVAASIALCYGLEINVVGKLAPGAPLANNLEWLGIAVTGLVVAGGSAGAVKLLQDVLGFRRSTRDETKEIKHAQRVASKLEAEARAEKAVAQIAGSRADLVGISARIVGAPLEPEEQSLEARIAERKLKIQRGV